MKSKKALFSTRVLLDPGTVPDGFPPIGTLVMVGDAVGLILEYPEFHIFESHNNYRIKIFHIKAQYFFYGWFSSPQEMKIIQEMVS